MKLLHPSLLMLLLNLVVVGLAQAQTQAAPTASAPPWMGVDSFADAAYLRPGLPAERDSGRLALGAAGASSSDALGSFGMLSRQGAVLAAAPVVGQQVAAPASFEAASSPVPELHPYALILAGLGVVAFMARRRGRR